MVLIRGHATAKGFDCSQAHDHTPASGSTGRVSLDVVAATPSQGRRRGTARFGDANVEASRTSGEPGSARGRHDDPRKARRTPVPIALASKDMGASGQVPWIGSRQQLRERVQTYWIEGLHHSHHLLYVRPAPVYGVQSGTHRNRMSLLQSSPSAVLP